MYLAIVALLLFVLPLTSVGIALGRPDHAPALMLAVQWFTFWGVGVRLFLAGLRRIRRPRYTAETILGIDPSQSAGALFVVRELGFANLSLGMIGIVSVGAPGWRPAAISAGMLFYALAGVNHALHKERKTNQQIAMISDLAFAILLFALHIAAHNV